MINYLKFVEFMQKEQYDFMVNKKTRQIQKEYVKSSKIENSAKEFKSMAQMQREIIKGTFNNLYIMDFQNSISLVRDQKPNKN